jgi:hypothetical protein
MLKIEIETEITKYRAKPSKLDNSCVLMCCTVDGVKLNLPRPLT